MAICSATEDCGKPTWERGWCITHYERFRKYGDFTTVTRSHSAAPSRDPDTFAERALALLDTDDAANDLPVRIGDRVVRALHEFDAAAIEELFSDGLLNVMDAPEFAQSEKLRRVFAALENRAYLGELLSSVAGAGRLQVFIGHENRPEELRDVSLVLAPYGRAGRAVGIVGVLGPTRMPYPRAIGTVRYVSALMNELVDHLYA